MDTRASLRGPTSTSVRSCRGAGGYPADGLALDPAHLRPALAGPPWSLTTEAQFDVSWTCGVRCASEEDHIPEPRLGQVESPTSGADGADQKVDERALDGQLGIAQIGLVSAPTGAQVLADSQPRALYPRLPTDRGALASVEHRHDRLRRAAVAERGPHSAA